MSKRHPPEPFVISPETQAWLNQPSGTKVRGEKRGTTIDLANIPDVYLSEEAKLDIARKLADLHAFESKALENEPKNTTLRYGKEPNTIIDLANIPVQLLNEKTKLEINECLRDKYLDDEFTHV
ncbi:hypothetical protein [Colwellia sp. BRX8-9]|uniref:hypothetical protein n=1 Tax=Colwellia sp. BRX8-9 TaxID=2759831 RepID=UPI0015F5F89F|nr:hypothetical protein [Colwellia sp. BRX8-9]MBA6348813.1 hypothetical protein [Colwellia sp. BRX8-9]